jgi:hypothetical protein
MMNRPGMAGAGLKDYIEYNLSALYQKHRHL